ncbi:MULTISPECIES: HD domain-containing protein [Paraliobacillus]|uniref:HD domain-containing protein n=1 Tax=Paraliobacillus TaxID=200903 RepID=UPI000DD3B91A|nr:MULTISPECIES: HD domain-containing protein [Paraliobacillus]
MSNQNVLLHEPLYPDVGASSIELALFASRPLRRLKHLAHFGAGSLISSVVHSRFEHTVGVWKLTAYFFPENIELRIAAILHDIGHLPFSHAVEKILDFNHHQLTVQYIKEKEINSILINGGIDPEQIINLLNMDSALTGIGNNLGIDHLDSFLRDTYMAGKLDVLPKNVLKKLACSQHGIETDEETGLYLLQLILADHQLFLFPKMVGIDRLLAEAIRCHWKEVGSETDRFDFTRMIDADVVNILKKSPSTKANKIINIVSYQPNRIIIYPKQSGKGYPIRVRKMYRKSPLCNGRLLADYNEQAQYIIDKLTSLTFEMEVAFD